MPMKTSSLCLLAFGATLLAIPSTAHAITVECENDFGSCSVSNDVFDQIECTCSDFGGGVSSGGDQYAGLTKYELLDICAIELSLCDSFGGDDFGGSSTSGFVDTDTFGGVTTVGGVTTFVGDTTGGDPTATAGDDFGTTGGEDTGFIGDDDHGLPCDTTAATGFLGTSTTGSPGVTTTATTFAESGAEGFGSSESSGGFGSEDEGFADVDDGGFDDEGGFGGGGPSIPKFGCSIGAAGSLPLWSLMLVGLGAVRRRRRS